jgi:hypothetical protein
MQYTERDRKMLVDLTRHGVETAEQLRRKFFQKEGGGFASLTAVYGRMKKLEGARPGLPRLRGRRAPAPNFRGSPTRASEKAP